jgi:putative phosphoribosyl transferase
MLGRTPVFVDRRDAGRKLAQAVQNYAVQEPIVLGLPRGGVPVAYEVARALDAPLDLILVRKIPFPGQPELGLGAIVDGADPQVVINEELERLVGSPDYLEQQKQRELAEIERRRKIYLGEARPLPVKNRTVMVVDDGIATGATTRAALKALRKSQARQIILAVPVASKSALEQMREDADDVVCLFTPEPFYAVGQVYDDFTQTTDDEVIRLLREARRERRAAAGL